MQDLRIQKIVVHMGVGESGEKLSKAEDVLTTITSQKPVKALAKKTQPAFGTRKDSPIGCKVTLRGDAAEKFFETSFGIVERQLDA
ncbi:MAG TPA: 50S ribosomal protein L5, partial [Methanomicrobiales archaeon]|nr:50S ribosomal protein L5 [Methanomicrobiales archaeon]